MRKIKFGSEAGRAKKDAYFHRQDAELIRALKSKEAANKESADMKQAAGIDDDVVAELVALGSKTTVPIFAIARGGRPGCLGPSRP